MTKYKHKGKNLNVLPTDRLVAIVAMFHVMEGALMKIATNFRPPSPPWDAHCFYCLEEMSIGCADSCPGLLARRALGVA
jgi:hypothetical protein